MGCSRIKSAVIALSAAALVAAPGAFSATPQDIYRDYADNGRLDNAYTPADLERVLKNAAVRRGERRAEGPRLSRRPEACRSPGSISV